MWVGWAFFRVDERYISEKRPTGKMQMFLSCYDVMLNFDITSKLLRFTSVHFYGFKIPKRKQSTVRIVKSTRVRPLFYQSSLRKLPIFNKVILS